jgi:cytochrome c-type biogenesis protein CcmH/NrfG
MTTPLTPPLGGNPGWPIRQVYWTAVGCLFLGIIIGYLFRGSESQAVSAIPVATQAVAPTNPHGMQQMPTLEQMKSMADKKAAPLLEKVKTEPNNASLLAQLGAIYKATHQFKEAEDYYTRALKVDPRNLVTRGDLAACLYFTGDMDGAIDQLQQTLKISPTDANSLFNLGVIKWQGKKDAAGALTAWRQLLKTNPNLEVDKKSQVEKMITEVSKSATK